MQLNKLAVQDAQVMFGDDMGAHSCLQREMVDQVCCAGRYMTMCCVLRPHQKLQVE